MNDATYLGYAILIVLPPKFGMLFPSTYHHHHMLDPVLSPSTELAGFRMVIVRAVFVWSLSLPTLPFCAITCILFSQSIFLHLILYFFFPRLFRSSSTTTHFKFQSLHYHIFIFFPQNITLPLYTASFSHPI